MPEFGEVLAELRKDKDLTQKELAKVLHVSIGTISNYEKKVHFPDIDKLEELANFFHVTTDYLLGRCRTIYPPDVFEEELVSGVTIGEFVHQMKQLAPSRKEALAVILRDMEFCALAGRYKI